MDKQKAKDKLIREKFMPRGDIILIEREKAAEEEGGIIIPPKYRLKGLLATVLRVGNAVDCVPDRAMLEGKKIFFELSGVMNAFGTKTNLAVAEGRSMVAWVHGKKHEQEFMPVNGWYVVKPDVLPEEEGGIVIPDIAKQPNPCMGTLLRQEDEGAARRIRPGARVVFRVSSSCPATEKGENVVLCHRPLAWRPTDDQEWMPLDSYVLVRADPVQEELVGNQVAPHGWYVVKPERRKEKGGIVVPDIWQRYPSTGKVFGIGAGAANLGLRPGDIVEVRRAQPNWMSMCGIIFDRQRRDMLLVLASDILGVHEA